MMDEDRLLKLLLDTYGGIGKRGKCQSHEHTTLAGVLVHFDSNVYKVPDGRTLFNEEDDGCVVVAMATGTKCIPESSRCALGTAVHDSHAEILVRRVLMRWLLDEIDLCKFDKVSLIFDGLGDGKTVKLREGLTFHLITTSPPCGDCSILEPSVGTSGLKRDRTGAKILKSAKDLPTASDVETYDATQQCGVIRRKPGKGPPTASVSCSDKILKWNLLGFQGCLMSCFLQKPLYFKRITAVWPIFDESASSAEASASLAMRRALWSRSSSVRELKIIKCMNSENPSMHAIFASAHMLEYHGLLQTEKRMVASGASTMWWAKPTIQWKQSCPNSVSQIPKGDKDYCEVIVGKTGYKLGAPKSVGEISQHISRVSRAAMRKRIKSLLEGVFQKNCDDFLSYQDFKKQVCPEYVMAWESIRKVPPLSSWISKSQ
jgi:hypothetical protein